MIKILYVLPLMAVLGIFSTVEASTEPTIQERIARMEAQITNLEEKISNADPTRQADRIAKWEAKIDRIQNRIDTLQMQEESTLPTQEEHVMSIEDLRENYYKVLGLPSHFEDIYTELEQIVETMQDPKAKEMKDDIADMMLYAESLESAAHKALHDRVSELPAPWNEPVYPESNNPSKRVHMWTDKSTYTRGETMELSWQVNPYDGVEYLKVNLNMRDGNPSPHFPVTHNGTYSTYIDTSVFRPSSDYNPYYYIGMNVAVPPGNSWHEGDQIRFSVCGDTIEFIPDWHAEGWRASC